MATIKSIKRKLDTDIEIYDNNENSHGGNIQEYLEHKKKQVTRDNKMQYFNYFFIYK